MSRIIDTHELQTLLERDPRLVLIEALPRAHYEEGHLPGALHLPHDEARERAAEVVPDRAAAIVVYCASETCRNSHTAAAALEQMGYRGVAIYAGGKRAWEEAGLPFERSGSAAA